MDEVQATVRSTRDDGSGSVFLDDGGLLEYPAVAFARSGLLRLRVGQRVRVLLDSPLPAAGTPAAGPRPVVHALTIATLRLPSEPLP